VYTLGAVVVVGFIAIAVLVQNGATQ